MLNWIYNTVGLIEDTTEYNASFSNKLDEFKKKRATKIIEKWYLHCKKNLELSKIRADRRKLYRVLNRTNAKLLQKLKNGSEFKNGIKY